MKRVAYAELLERLRTSNRLGQSGRGPLDGVTLPRRKDATKRLEVRLSAAQKAFVREAVAAARSGPVDESTVVAAALAILQDLDVAWENVTTREELIDAIRRKLRTTTQ
jgi:hypothetical protein